MQGAMRGYNWADFPGGPVVKTLCLHCRGHGSIPGRGTKIPPAAKKNKQTKTGFLT